MRLRDVQKEFASQTYDTSSFDNQKPTNLRLQSYNQHELGCLPPVLLQDYVT